MFYPYSLWISNFFIRFSFLQKNLKWIQCIFTFFISEGKMKNEIQLTRVVLLQQACFKQLGALHEQVLPQRSTDCPLHKNDSDTWRSATSEINIFKFFMRVTPYFIWLIFLSFFHIDSIIQNIARRITNNFIKVFFWLATLFSVAQNKILYHILIISKWIILYPCLMMTH